MATMKTLALACAKADRKATILRKSIPYLRDAEKAKAAHDKATRLESKVVRLKQEILMRKLVAANKRATGQ